MLLRHNINEYRERFDVVRNLTTNNLATEALYFADYFLHLAKLIMLSSHVVSLIIASGT